MIMVQQQRNRTLDMMKGIAILLMMVCHLVFTEGPIWQFVYTFHMPLFFILAGIFAKDIAAISSFKEYTRKNAKRLLLPYFVTFMMLCAWGAIQAVAKHDAGFFLKQFFSMLAATIDGYESPWGLIYAGPMWFLVSLFWVRELFYGIQRACIRVQKYTDELIVGVCVALSVASVLIRPLLPALPLCVLPAFTSIAFYAVGWYIHNHPQPWWVYGLCVFVWPIAYLYGKVELDVCRLDFYPLSFIGACGGTYMVYLLCKGIDKLSTFTRSFVHPITGSLAWCGMYSLPILCMHELEIHSDIYYSVMCRMPISCESAWGGYLPSSSRGL